MINNGCSLLEFDCYSITVDSRCFKSAGDYNESKAKFINISPKLKTSTRVIEGKELCTVTLDPKSVTSSTEYYQIKNELFRLIKLAKNE